MNQFFSKQMFWTCVKLDGCWLCGWWVTFRPPYLGKSNHWNGKYLERERERDMEMEKRRKDKRCKSLELRWKTCSSLSTWKMVSPLKVGKSVEPETKNQQMALSSGYGRRLASKRSWVWILAPDAGWTYFTYTVKNCSLFKNTDINDKRGRVRPI